MWFQNRACEGGEIDLFGAMTAACTATTTLSKDTAAASEEFAKVFDALRSVGCQRAGVLPSSDLARKDGAWFLDMRNEVSGMKVPCVMDIKVGKMRTTPSAGAKGEAKEAKDMGTTSKAIGLRVCGVHHVVMKSGEERLVETTAGLDKEFGRFLTPDTFQHALRAFCTVALAWDEEPQASASVSEPIFSRLARRDMRKAGIGINRSIAERYSRKLRELAATLRSHPPILACLCFLSTSVMVAYDCAAQQQGGGGEPVEGGVVIKLIDFARSGPRPEHYPESDVDFIESIDRLAEAFGDV